MPTTRAIATATSSTATPRATSLRTTDSRHRLFHTLSVLVPTDVLSEGRYELLVRDVSRRAVEYRAIFRVTASVSR
jgi:hypothetical protein